jgi:hypothetical protein
MSDKALVILFALSAIVCLYAIFQYSQKLTQKYFITAAISGLICAGCFIWVYYDF